MNNLKDSELVQNNEDIVQVDDETDGTVVINVATNV